MSTELECGSLPSMYSAGRSRLHDHEMLPPGLDGILKSSKITGKLSEVTSLFQTAFMKTCFSPSHSSELEIMIREVAH